MRSSTYSLYISILFLTSPTIFFAQIGQDDWVIDHSKSLDIRNAQAFNTLPLNYITADINVDIFYKKLLKRKQEIVLPNPEGDFDTYVVRPSDVNAPEVAHLYTIKTFHGYLKSDSSIKIACDIYDLGFSAAIYNHERTFFIGPTDYSTISKHIVYFKEDLHVNKAPCQVTEMEKMINKDKNMKSFIPTQKRTYRLAVSASWEYAQQFGSAPYNVTNVLNAIASGINMLNPIYLRDFGINFSNVTNASIIFQNANADPYTRPFGNATLDQELPNVMNSIGNANYDIGHLVVWSDIGGLAGPNPCDNSSKAGGYSGANGSVSTLWIDFVAHEIGHQFGIPHNFSNSCGGNGEDNFRYEPGEGSSIMSYANVCGTGYTQASDPFFAITSINAAQSWINGHTCPATDGTGNTSDPSITQPGNITIPKETSFILVGAATDANDPVNNLTYAWEQNDGNGPATTGAPTGSASTEPLFRFRPASSNNYRHFPDFASSLGGNNISVWERLSSVARTINFSLTVRDNNASFGRIGQATNAVTVANTGPFNVTAPNGGETVNTTTTVTWAVNGTNAHCANVDILISTDGGMTFSIVTDATPNDGTELINIPAGNSVNARILVRCDVAGGFRAASTFYDVSDANFTIDGNSIPCPPNYNLSGTATMNNVYKSDGYIKSSHQVNSPTQITYNSKSFVELLQGFDVKTGAIFMALLEGCQTTGGNDPDGSCEAPYVLICGTPFTGNLTGGQDNWIEYTDGDGFATGESYQGAERIHSLTIPPMTSTTITLSGFANDLDFFITSACSSSTTESNSGAQEIDGIDEAATITNGETTAATFHIVVDGWSGDIGSYTLSCN